MTDERRMTTDRFYGGISDRLRNLLSMLEHVDKEEPSRDELTNWIISNTNAGSPDAVSHHLTFLDSIDMIKLDERNCGLGRYGERYLANRDNETLYECLSSGVKGFDILLEELADGPMADEDIMDLLVEEFEEAEMSKPGPAIRHREWLQVLGYVERENGTNRLTDEGERFLEAEVAIEVSKTQTKYRNVATEEVDLPDGQRGVEKREVDAARAKRDSAVVRSIKRLYENTCQVCGKRRLKNDDEGHSNVYHLKPLADDGPDVPENVVVVCPNHHADFENGMLRVDPETLEIDHEYESDVSGSKLLLEDEHDVEPEYLKYHNREVVE
jgi:hypothetical protein